jgi:secreted trypsin-like serine protease
LHATLSKRIVGGTEADQDEFPHQAAILYKEVYFGCGGSLISPNFVLTAAHCLATPVGPASHVRLGANSLVRDKSYTVEIPVSEIIGHPNYDKPNIRNDIGLLKLQEHVKFSNRVLPACLPTQFYKTESVVASGYGRTGPLEDISVKLLKVTIDRFSNQECNRIYDNINESIVICYGSRTENKGTCKVRLIFIKFFRVIFLISFFQLGRFWLVL